MNDLCYDYSQDGVFWIVLIVFLFTKRTKKTEIKDGLQYKTKNITRRWYNYIYNWGFSNELEKVHFLNNFVFLKPPLYEAPRTTWIITWKQMFLHSKNKKWGNLKFLLMKSSVFWGTPISRNDFQWLLSKIRYVTWNGEDNVKQSKL